jgi:hypothetical protein
MEVVDERVVQVDRAAGRIDVIDVAFYEFGELRLVESRQKRLFGWWELRILWLILIGALRSEGV